MGQIGVDVLKNNLTNPARVYQWDFEIPAPKGVGSTDVWFIRAQSAHIPGKNFEDILINYKATGGFNVPGRERYDHSIEIIVLEGEDRRGFDAINSWMNLIRDPRTGEGSADNDLKTDAIVTLTKANGEIWMAIKLIGIYPKAVANVDLTYNTSKEISYSVTFSYDRWEPMN